MNRNVLEYEHASLQAMAQFCWQLINLIAPPCREASVSITFWSYWPESSRTLVAFPPSVQRRTAVCGVIDAIDLKTMFVKVVGA